MKTARLQVLSQVELECIHALSLEILTCVVVKVNYKTARDSFRNVDADGDDFHYSSVDCFPHNS